LNFIVTRYFGFEIMAKELLLYFPITAFSAETLIDQIEENSDEDIVMRINSPGGSVFAGWGIASKMKEHDGEITVKVDGVAASMSAILLLFADKVEVLDVTKIMLHRAEMFTMNDQEVNAEIKAKLKSKIDSKKLKELKGITIDQLFNSEQRIDLWLTAKEAKKIG